MKKLLFLLLAFAPLSLFAQNVYVTGGYVLDRPTIKDGLKENGLLTGGSNIITGPNGQTQIDKIKQHGFFAGAGIVLKTKKTSTFGLRIEAAYERHALTLDRTFTIQMGPFTEQITYADRTGGNNSYLRFTPSFSYYKLKRSGKIYQADLGFTQLVHLGGWKESGSFSAVHASAGIGYGGILLKAGTEIGLSNTFGGEGKAYTAISKRFFVGVNIYPFLLMKEKKKEEAPQG